MHRSAIPPKGNSPCILPRCPTSPRLTVSSEAQSPSGIRAISPAVVVTPNGSLVHSLPHATHPYFLQPQVYLRGICRFPVEFSRYGPPVPPVNTRAGISAYKKGACALGANGDVSRMISFDSPSRTTHTQRIPFDFQRNTRCLCEKRASLCS